MARPAHNASTKAILILGDLIWKPPYGFFWCRGTNFPLLRDI
jgi:hypothetical protein